VRLSQLDPVKVALLWRYFRFVAAASAAGAVVAAAALYVLWIASGCDPQVGADFLHTGLHVWLVLAMAVVWNYPPLTCRLAFWLARLGK
jgi:hypothetical protein